MMQNDRKITRRGFIGTTIAGAAAAAALIDTPVHAARRPNIVFILADDMGWGDLSCYGRPDYRTPNLDRLAQQGMRFTNAYSAAPVCTPTRVGFHTGRYPARLPVGLEEPIIDRSHLGDRIKVIGIPHDHPTISSLLKNAGYHTALLGKWHLGYLPEFSPIRSGFDEFFGIMSGAGDFFTHVDPAGNPDLFEAEVPVERVGYITDLLTDRAVEYVKKPRTEPFYLSLHYTSPHWPWEGPQDSALSKTLKHGPVGFSAGGSLKVYGEMVKNLDAGVGKLMAALKSSGIERNTLLIFTSDNGGERFSYNWPFRGEKFDVYEGGVRVPGLVRWPGVVSPGSRTDQPLITMDWTATILAAAGTGPDAGYPLDGDDMLPVLTGKRPVYDRTFFWRTYKQGAMRSGKWKYVREGKNEALYDLSFDEHEQHDFSSAEPSLLTKMRKDFDGWASEMQKYPARKNA